MFKKQLALFMSVIFSLSIIFFALSNPLPVHAEETTQKTPEELAIKAIEFIHTEYLKGERVSGFDAYVLVKAGEDLTVSDWVYEGITLQKSLENYADNLSNSSCVKRIGEHLMFFNKVEDTSRSERLTNLLEERHCPITGFSDNYFGDVWAYMALKGQVAGQEHILSRQIIEPGETDGAWDKVWADLLATSQTLYVLTYYAGDAVKQASDRGLVWIKTQQQDDGSIFRGWDDPVVSTASVVTTLVKLGIDPNAWKNEQGLSPVDFMLTKALNPEDGSFGSVGNIYGASTALQAYLALGARPAPDPGDDPGNGDDRGTSPAVDTITVGIAVVGKNGEVLFSPSSRTLSEDNPWELTAMGALNVTGLNYTLCTKHEGFVTGIEGQFNEAKSGWMYNVDGYTPSVLAKDFVVDDNDRVMWWFSEDFGVAPPAWEDLKKRERAPAATRVPVEDKIPGDINEINKSLPAELQLSSETISAWQELFEKDDVKTIITGDDFALRDALNKNLKEVIFKTSNISQDIVAAKGGIIIDDNNVFVKIIPAEAIKDDFTVGIKTETVNNIKGYTILSPVYQFSPTGKQFEEPVLVNMKIVVPPLVKPENIIFAKYAEDSEKWLAIPAVLDLEKGLLTAKLEQYSKYIVIAKKDKQSFKDISETSFYWAKDVIEQLAGVGIIAGVDGEHFEPGRAITRAEFTSLLVKALELDRDQDGSSETGFNDVQVGKWYSDAIGIAVENNLVSGYEDDTFRPYREITREEAVAVILRTMNVEVEETKQQTGFIDDGEISDWARASIATASAMELISGYEDGTLQPRADINRAEGAAIIYRMLMHGWY